MWSGWFGGFTQPSDYANAEMPSFNFKAIIVSSVFIIPYIAFLLVLPGVRQKRLITLIVFTITTFVGAILAVSLYYPGWVGGSARIVTQFRAHITERMRAQVGVDVGLRNINITLRFEEIFDEFGSNTFDNDMSRLFYNEQFDISGVSSMAEALRSAYFHGLPYPILSVLEYFSLNQDAFDWGRHYRTAGHYTHAAVCFALACWSLTVVFLFFVPHHFGKGMLSTGLSALFGCLLYLLMSPCKLRIGFVGTNGERMHMDMGFRWAFYLVFIVGLIALFFGLLLILLQHYRFYTLSTFLDATLDETVGPKRRGGQEDSPLRNFPNSLEVMRQCKPSRTGSTISEKKSGGSSGFQSRSSYSDSLRSHSSFESMPEVSELDRSPSNLTIREERCPISKNMTLYVEHF